MFGNLYNLIPVLQRLKGNSGKPFQLYMLFVSSVESSFPESNLHF